MKEVALVTGANGALGPELVKQLVDRGHCVRAFVRDTSKPLSLPKSVQVLRGDLNDEAALREATVGVGWVFHLAAKLHVNDPDPKLRDEYFQVNVEGTRRLAEAAEKAGVRRLIFFSTISVYGPTQPGDVFNEDSPLHPDSLYAETKARAEEIVLKSLPSIVLRLAAVYGPRMKGNYPRLLNALRKRRLAIIGDGSNRRTLVYTEDVCRAAILAAEHGAAPGNTFNVTDGTLHTLREIINAMSDALGQSRPKIHLPKGPVRLSAGLIEDGLQLLGKKSAVGRKTVDKFVEDIAVSGDKIQKELGYYPCFDLHAGWRATVQQLVDGSH